ncbi:hypothetical protein Uis1B_0868 [Bifidobacterium margollesii]|uniref:Uncharacterized protein n=1 Tax=Bifidobacterium margollesii TaxID=2020964 RepID=A0A2N5JAW8_9BIFI|nr:hypothetical protein [Bifidobacterium margollesii]PLS31352.1 hypothetical protein Uis1B_0868 [Bifidobacterium margollesii]
MNLKKSMLRGLALYGASNMTTASLANKQIAETVSDIVNDVR